MDLNTDQLIRALNLSKLGGKTKCISPSITTSAGAYTSGDCVGGVLTLDAPVSDVNGTCILKSIVVKDNANQNADLTVLIFNSNPSGATTTDNSAFAWGSTSFPKCVGRFNVSASDYESINSKSIANVDTIASPIQSDGSVLLYAVVITTGTPTYAANATTLYVTFNFLVD